MPCHKFDKQLCHLLSRFGEKKKKKKAKKNPVVRDLAPGRATQIRAVSTFLAGKWMKVGAI